MSTMDVIRSTDGSVLAVLATDGGITPNTGGPTAIERELQQAAIDTGRADQEDGTSKAYARFSAEQGVVNRLHEVQKLDRDLAELATLDSSDAKVQQMTADRKVHRNRQIEEMAGCMRRLPVDEGLETSLTNIAMEVTPTNYGPYFSRGVADRVAWLRLVAAGRIDLRQPLDLQKGLDVFEPHLLPVEPVLASDPEDAPKPSRRASAK